MLTILDHAIIKRYRRSIQTVEDILANDERRTALGFTREYFEECRVHHFCALINHQVRTFDRNNVSKFCTCPNNQRSQCAYCKGGYCT